METWNTLHMGNKSCAGTRVWHGHVELLAPTCQRSPVPFGSFRGATPTGTDCMKPSEFPRPNLRWVTAMHFTSHSETIPVWPVDALLYAHLLHQLVQNDGETWEGGQVHCGQEATGLQFELEIHKRVIHGLDPRPQKRCCQTEATMGRSARRSHIKRDPK